jgi:hypothetical protein
MARTLQGAARSSLCRRPRRLRSRFRLQTGRAHRLWRFAAMWMRSVRFVDTRWPCQQSEHRWRSARPRLRPFYRTHHMQRGRKGVAALAVWRGSKARAQRLRLLAPQIRCNCEGCMSGVRIIPSRMRLALQSRAAALRAPASAVRLWPLPSSLRLLRICRESLPVPSSRAVHMWPVLTRHRPARAMLHTSLHNQDARQVLVKVQACRPTAV